jgi:hypothetical protein
MRLMIDVFPAPVAPTMATLSPGGDREVHVAQDPVALVVGEGDVAESDLAAHVRQLDRVLRVQDVRARIEQPEDAL